MSSITALTAPLTASLGAVTDATLLDRQRVLAEWARSIEAASLAVAAEVAHRSRRELGYDGLAQRLGARTPERLVQSVTGTSGSTSRRLVRVAGLLDSPPLAPLVTLLETGSLSAEGFDGVASVLASIDGPEAVASVVGALASEAPALDADALIARARDLRDDHAAAHVAANEEALRARRHLRLTALPDGMTRISGLLDPESAAVLVAAVDAATSPRRGGPRFVDPVAARAAEQLLADPRTTDQLALDALVELVDVAVRSRDHIGHRRPDVRILVTQRDLNSGIGAGRIEGQTASVSIDTVTRHGCDGGYVPILFDDDGQALNLGRSQRLHSARQRVAIAARDGGCLAPGCDRPPGWCEVHHITEFSRGGRTDLADGVLLCRYHHLLVHNNRWRIERRDGRYWMVPPLTSGREPFLLATKSAAVRRLLASSPAPPAAPAGVPGPSPVRFAERIGAT